MNKESINKNYKFRIIETMYDNGTSSFLPQFKTKNNPKWNVCPQDTNLIELLCSYDSLTKEHAEQRINRMINNLLIIKPNKEIIHKHNI